MLPASGSQPRRLYSEPASFIPRLEGHYARREATHESEKTGARSEVGPSRFRFLCSGSQYRYVYETHEYDGVCKYCTYWATKVPA